MLEKRDFKALVRGSVYKFVRCEGCQLEYVYLLSRKAKGEASSFLHLDNEGARERANNRAERKLNASLEADIDVVPCPGCGLVQADMVHEARKVRFWWIADAGCFCLPIAVILYLLAKFHKKDTASDLAWADGFWWSAVVVGAMAAGFGTLKYLLTRDYDPNDAALEERLEQARSRAMSKAEFDEKNRPKPLQLPFLAPPSTNLPDLPQ